MGGAVVEAVITQAFIRARVRCPVDRRDRAHPRPIPVHRPETEGGLRLQTGKHSPERSDKARVSVRLLPTSGGAPSGAETLEEGCEDIFDV